MGDVLMHIITALLGGGLVAILMYPATKRETNARTDKTAAEAWALLSENQMKQLAALLLRVECLEKEQAVKDLRIDDLEQEVDDLRTWIEGQGLTPPPRKRPMERIR